MNAVQDSAAGPRLDGRAVLITGAHGGLGRALALACAMAGATPVLLGRKSRRLEQVADGRRQCLHLRPQRFGEGGGDEPAAGPDEQRIAELLPHLAEQAAERRRLHIQLPGGQGDVPLRQQGIQRHDHAPARQLVARLPAPPAAFERVRRPVRSHGRTFADAAHLVFSSVFAGQR